MTLFGFEIKESIHIHHGHSGNSTNKTVEIYYNGCLLHTYHMSILTQFILSESELIELLQSLHGKILEELREANDKCAETKGR